MTQADLFDQAQTTSARPDGWHPTPPPPLNGETSIRLDAETTGLQWWAQDRVVGVAYVLPASGRKGYLPFAHQGGGNLGESQVLDWLRDLRGMHVENINTKFDIHIARATGVDLVEQGCTFGDVAHRAALLDDHRFRFNLEQLAKDFLGVDEGKYDLNLRNKGMIHQLPAWVVEPYAIQDVVLVDRLVNVMQPEIEAQDLERVLKLEQDIIPVVVEMEKNGVYLDVETLHRWQHQARAEFNRLLWNIRRETGVAITSPDSSRDLAAIFRARKIPITAFTGTFDKQGNPRPSFTEDVLKTAAAHDPVIADVFYASQLADLLSKYLDKYANTVRPDGWMRFNLHQLRVGRSEQDKFGTVSGRFSSAGDDYGGFNAQQVVSADKQTSRNWCTEYVIRNLFKPQTPWWLASDAKQIEYRIFAHFSNAPDIIQRYRDDPETDYHNVVQEVLRRIKPNIGRKHTKITNFAKLFGSGIIKFAHTLETISTQQYDELTAKYAAMRNKRGVNTQSLMRQEPLLQEALSVYDAYDLMFPSAHQTLEEAKQAARDRGFVRTLWGRRARFPGKQRLHSALNRAIQGTAADINKLMLVDVYRHRHELGLTLRLTVHDEVDADLNDPTKVPLIEAFMNQQRVPLRVPILWDVSIGPTWGTAKGKA